MQTPLRLRSRGACRTVPRFAPARWSPRTVVAACAAFAGWGATLVSLAASASPARAELVILTSGEYLKVESYLAEGERARLILRDGASLTLALNRVERVIDDEIVPQAPVPALPEGPEKPPPFPVRFDAREPVPTVPYGALLYEAAKRHDVHPRIVVEMARAESNFRPTAVSYKGAVGILQIMPATGRRFGLTRGELFDPKKNADAAVRYVAWLLRRFGDDLTKALAGYNAGEGAVDRYAGVPPYRETRAYVKRILDGIVAPGVVPTAG
jgi:hypothetical protein